MLGWQLAHASFLKPTILKQWFLCSSVSFSWFPDHGNPCSPITETPVLQSRKPVLLNHSFLYSKKCRFIGKLTRRQRQSESPLPFYHFFLGVQDFLDRTQRFIDVEAVCLSWEACHSVIRATPAGRHAGRVRQDSWRRSQGPADLGRDVVPFSHCLFLAGLRTWIDCSGYCRSVAPQNHKSSAECSRCGSARLKQTTQGQSGAFNQWQVLSRRGHPLWTAPLMQDCALPMFATYIYIYYTQYIYICVCVCVFAYVYIYMYIYVYIYIYIYVYI